MHIRPYEQRDQDEVITLWRACNLVKPQNNPYSDIAVKLTTQPELFLVGKLGGRIVASLMAGFEGHRGWINYLAVDPARRRSGLGREMVAKAEEKLRALGCPKINLQVRLDNQEAIAFYTSLGFVEDEVVSLGKRLG